MYSFYDMLPYAQQGGQQDQVMQLIQMYAKMQGVDPRQVMQQLKQMQPQDQQKALQQISQVVQQQGQQQGQMMASGGTIKDENCLNCKSFYDDGGIIDDIRAAGKKTKQFITGLVPNNALSLGRMAAATLGIPVGNFVNKSDFSKEQLKMIYDAAKTAQKRTNSPHGGTMYSDYGKEYGNIWNRGLLNSAKDSFLDPKFQLGTTLGRFTYNVNPDNTINITDDYDFNKENTGIFSKLIQYTNEKFKDDPRKRSNFTITPDDFKQYGGNIQYAKLGSIIDYLNENREDNSFKARLAQANKLGILNYKGTTAQNKQLLNMLQNKRNIISKNDTLIKNNKKIDSNTRVLNTPESLVKSIRPEKGYIDLNKYGLDPLSRDGIEKARELEALYPGTKFICTAEGCAQIAGKAADAYGQNFSKGNAWDYGNINDVTFQNPVYANLITGKQGVLPDPSGYKVPLEILNSSNQVIGLNRKNNLIDNEGKKLKNTLKNIEKTRATAKQDANDSYDYANQELYPNSRGYEHVGFSLGNHQLLHGTGKSKDHPAFYVVDNMDNGIDLSGYGQYEPVESINPANFIQKTKNNLKKGYNYLSDLVSFDEGGTTPEEFLKQAKLAKTVPQGYVNMGKVGNRTLYSKTTMTPAMGGLKPAMSGSNTGQNPEQYNQKMISMVQQGYSPEDLAKQGYISKENISKYSPYYTAPQTQQDFLYTEEDKPIPFSYADEFKGTTYYTPEGAARFRGRWKVQPQDSDSYEMYQMDNRGNRTGTYRVPNDVWYNKYTRDGYDKIFSEEGLEQYRIPDYKKMGGMIPRAEVGMSLYGPGENMSMIAPEMLSQPMTPEMPVAPEMITNVTPPPMVSNNTVSSNTANISPVVLKDKKLSKAVQTNDVFEFMKAVEGFAKKAEWDYAQYTNGYGTRAKYPGEVIDRKEAQRRLEEEMGTVMGKIQKKLKVPVTNGQLIALASLNYNTGSAANRLIKAINNGEDASTIAQKIRNLPKTGVGSNKVLDWQIKRRNAEADIFARGFEYGGIHINPANEGKFTASANRAGMGVQQFASQVLANKEDYSPLQVKRANFARNAAGWNHEGGGHTEGSIMDVSPEQMDQLRQQGYQFEILN